MAQYPTCNLAWIEPVVNAFAANTTLLPISSSISGGDITSFTKCCSAPGECHFLPENKLPLITCSAATRAHGILDCRLGNSKFVCEFSQFSPTSPNPPTIGDATTTITTTTVTTTPTGAPLPLPTSFTTKRCLQEGDLAVKRSLPCCQSQHLSTYLKTIPCLQGGGALEDIRDTKICCKIGNGGCDSSNKECDLSSWTYEASFFGDKNVVYSGYAREFPTATSPLQLQCVEEAELMSSGPPKVDSPSCVNVTKSGCNSAVNPPGMDANGGKTSLAKKRVGGVRKVVLFMAAPLLIQMLFL